MMTDDNICICKANQVDKHMFRAVASGAKVVMIPDFNQGGPQMSLHMWHTSQDIIQVAVSSDV